MAFLGWCILSRLRLISKTLDSIRYNASSGQEFLREVRTATSAWLRDRSHYEDAHGVIDE